MRLLGAATLIILGLTSCRSYQYTVLQSDLPKSEASNYYYQDSLVQIDFNFWGKNFPIRMTIANKSEAGLYLDLERTLFIRNDRVLRSAVRKTVKRTTTTVDTTYFLFHKDVSYHTKSEVKVPPHVLYIPKGKRVVLKYTVFHFPYNKTIRKQSKVSTTESNKSIKYVPQYVFPKNEKPVYAVHFYFQTDTHHPVEHTVQCTFSPKKVLTTSWEPLALGNLKPTTFYTMKANRGGKALGQLGVICLFPVIAATIATAAK